MKVEINEIENRKTRGNQRIQKLVLQKDQNRQTLSCLTKKHRRLKLLKPEMRVETLPQILQK